MKNYQTDLKKLSRGGFITLMLLALFGLSVSAQKSANTNRALVSTTIVISQIYGGGGNAGSTYTNDFIELHNRGNVTVDVTGWTVQYTSATGTTWATTVLSGMIAPGKYFLVQEAVGAGGTTPLPTPDATGAIAMGATAGKVALVNTNTALTGACPTGATIVDFVGYGLTANCSETAVTPVPSNTNAVLRVSSGNIDTDNNSTDFVAGAPTPRNSAASPTAAGAIIAGQVKNASGNGISKVRVTLSGGQFSAPITAITNPFGYYRFEAVEVGNTFVISVSSKVYTFANPSRIFNLNEDITDADFVSNEP